MGRKRVWSGGGAATDGAAGVIDLTGVTGAEAETVRGRLMGVSGVPGRVLVADSVLSDWM